MWPLNVGQVYTTLQRLERDGLIESDDPDDGDDGGPQKAFRITPGGNDELSNWLHTPPDLSLPPRQLVIKVLVALRVPGVDVHEVIQVHRRYVVQVMQQWTHLKEDEADFDLNFALVVDAEPTGWTRWSGGSTQPTVARSGPRWRRSEQCPQPSQVAAQSRSEAMSRSRTGSRLQGLRPGADGGARPAGHRPDR